MSIQANVTNQQITASVGETKIDVSVSGGVGPTGAQGPSGEASLPAGTEGYVLTYVSGSWTAAAPASGYTLPTASSTVLGGVKIGSGITITDGVISASSGYTLPTASAGTLGGVKIGSNVTITDGVISVAAPFSGAYDDLTGKPSLFDGSYTSLANVPSTFTPASHNQAWSTITSTPTTLSGYGITDAVASADSRLTDARTPTAHKASHATGGTDALSPADIGAASATHAHTASDTTSGTFDIARIPTGTTSTTVCIGNDARLSDARTPTAHNQAWSTITSTPTTRSGYGITDAQKTITSGTTDPTGGVDGDIYLKYTA